MELWTKTGTDSCFCHIGNIRARMLKLMDLRKERTLKLLREAAIELLHEKPFQKITVSEICERAMVRRPTFYRHFQSKEDLLLYAIRMRRDSIQQSLLGDEARTISVVDYALTKNLKPITRSPISSRNMAATIPSPSWEQPPKSVIPTQKSC